MKWNTTNPIDRLNLLEKENVNKKVLLLSEIVVDYFIRQNKFTIFPNYCSKEIVLIKVSNNYGNVKYCKTAELYVTINPHIKCLLYEKYGNFEKEQNLYIEELFEITNWLIEPPSWIIESKKTQSKEEFKFTDYRFRGSPVNLKEALDKVITLSKTNALIKGNKVQFFNSPIEAKNFYWELVEWLNS